jgi:hypothetical protein
MRYAAERRNLAESVAELREIADGRDNILAEAAGITAGSWYSSPATHVGYELIGAGMLILAAGGRGLPMDYDELERWTRVGYERGMRSRKGERNSRRKRVSYFWGAASLAGVQLVWITPVAHSPGPLSKLVDGSWSMASCPVLICSMGVPSTVAVRVTPPSSE